MARKRNEERIYDYEELRDERKYGFFWYSGLWGILRPVLVGLGALLIVFGLISMAYMSIKFAK